MVSPTVDRRFGTVGSLAIKAPVTTAVFTPITLSGEQTVSGVTVTASDGYGRPDRVLVGGQADATTNGFYDVSTAAWTRSADANGSYDVVKGTVVYVKRGTYAGLWFAVATADPITIGSSSITFSSSALSADVRTDLADRTSAVKGAGMVGHGVTQLYAAGTVGAKLQESISVMDFGAVGDGVADDTAALNAAFAYAYDSDGTAQKTVFFPSGIYRLTDTVTAMASFRGEGPYENNAGSRIRWEGSAGQVLLFPNDYKTGWSFENLEIDMSGVTSDCVAMYFALGLNNASFRNLRIKGYWSGGGFYAGTYANHDGIYVVGGSGAAGSPYNMSNCVFDHVFFLRNRNCLTVTNPVPDSSGTNCTFNACFSTSTGWFAKMGGANNNFICCETNSMIGSHTFVQDGAFAYSWTFITCDFGTQESAPGNEIVQATAAGAVTIATFIGGTLETSYNGGLFNGAPDLVLDPGATSGRVFRYLAYGLNNYESSVLKVDQLRLGQALSGELVFYEPTTAFTPAFTSLTLVLGGGSVAYTGVYVRIGELVQWQVKITTAGGATTASTAGTTFISNLPFTQSDIDTTCTARNATSGASLGVGGGTVTTKSMYTPTWAATANTIVISGCYVTDGT